MKTNKEVEENSGVTVNRFSEGKGHKTVSNSDLSQSSFGEWLLEFLCFVGALDGRIVPYQEMFGLPKQLLFTALSLCSGLWMTKSQNELYHFYIFFIYLQNIIWSKYYYWKIKCDKCVMK